MARVPGIDRVGAGDIGIQRTVLPRVTVDPDLGAGARALVELGADIGVTGDQLTQLGEQEQAKDNAREVQDRMTRFKQDIFDHTYGNRDKNITGFRETKAQTALDGSKAFRDKIEELRLKNSGEITNSDIQAAFTAASQNKQLETFNVHARYLVGERQTAENASDAAALQQYFEDIAANPQDPNNTSRYSAIVALSLRMADRQGITDETARENLVMSNLTGAHQAAIDTLLDNGRASEAEAYFIRFKAQIAPTVRGGIVKNIRNVGIRQEAQDQFDAILAIPFEKGADRLAAAHQIEDPKVKDSVVARVRQHNADLARQKNEDEKNLRTNAVAKANQGENIEDTLTVEELEVVNQTPGMLQQLRSISQRKASGRPFTSNVDIRGNVFAMQRDNPEAFMKLDFSKPPYTAGLNPADVNMFQSAQLALDNRIARQEAADQKEVARGARLNRALTATKDMIRSFGLKDEEEANLKTALSLEIEKLAEEGETLTDTNYRNIVRGLFLEGEHKGEGLIDDPDIRLFETIAKRLRTETGEEAFDISDFADDDEYIEAVNSIAVDTGIASQDVDLISRQILQAGRVPTPLLVRRQYDRAIAARARRPVVPAAPTPVAAPEPETGGAVAPITPVTSQ